MLRREASPCAATSAKAARKRWPSGWIPTESSITCSRTESCKKSSDSWYVDEGSSWYNHERCTTRNACGGGNEGRNRCIGAGKKNPSEGARRLTPGNDVGTTDAANLVDSSSPSYLLSTVRRCLQEINHADNKGTDPAVQAQLPETFSIPHAGLQFQPHAKPRAGSSASKTPPMAPDPAKKAPACYKNSVLPPKGESKFPSTNRLVADRTYKN